MQRLVLYIVYEPGRSTTLALSLYICREVVYDIREYMQVGIDRLQQRWRRTTQQCCSSDCQGSRDADGSLDIKKAARER